MNKQEYENKMAEEELKKTIKEFEEAEEEKENENKEILNEIEDLPDLEEYIKSEGYLRSGKDNRIPLKIDINGTPVRVYIRPLTSQEYYTLQRKGTASKESLDLLACQEVCTDSKGKKISPIILDQLPAGVILSISTAITAASGIQKDEIDMTEVVKDFLRD